MTRMKWTAFVVAVLGSAIMSCVLGASISVNLTCFLLGCGPLDTLPVSRTGAPRPESNASPQTESTSVSRRTDAPVESSRGLPTMSVTTSPRTQVTVWPSEPMTPTPSPSVRGGTSLPKAIVLTATPRPSRERSIELSESDAALELAAQARRQNLQIANPRVSFRNGTFQMSGQVTIPGSLMATSPTPFTASFAPRIDGRELTVSDVTVVLAGIDVTVLYGDVFAQVARQAFSSRFPAYFDVTSFGFGNGVFTVVGREILP